MQSITSRGEVFGCHIELIFAESKALEQPLA